MSRPSTVVVDRHGERLFEARSALGTARRIARRGGAAAALVARDARGRGRALSSPSRRRSDRDRPRGRRMTCARWRVVEGGSTITQQVAKLLLARQAGGRRRARLAREDPRSGHRAASRTSADEGRDPRALSESRAVRQSDRGRGARGRARTSDARAATLTPAEAAFLAALPQQPSRFNPRTRSVQRARPRQQRILDVDGRAADGCPTRRCGAARAERSRSAIAMTRPLVAPHFVERVLADGRPRTSPAGSRRRSTPDCSAPSTASSPPNAADARSAPRRQRRGRRARQSHRRMAGVGRIGQLLRRRHGGAIDGVDRRRGSRVRR